jgi:mRNA interferase RelE/StbE
MEYSLELTPAASQYLAKLTPSSLQRITTKLEWYAMHSEEYTPEPLTGKFNGLYRFRIGDYRLIYMLDKPNKRIVILSAGHRSDIYKSR